MRDVVLGDSLLELIDYRGKTPKKLGTDFTESGVPVASAMLVSNGVLDLSSARFVSPETYEAWMKIPLRQGDVLLTSEAPLGRVGRVSSDEPLVLGQRLYALRGRPNVLDNGYLYYVLQTNQVQADLVGRSSGTTVFGIRQSALRQVRIPAPPIRMQKAIAEVLGALDEKIAANRAVASTADSLYIASFQDLLNESLHCTSTSLEALVDDIIGGDWGKESPQPEFTEEALCLRGTDIPNVQLGWLGKAPIRFLKAKALSRRALRPGSVVVEVSGGSPTQSTGRSALATQALLRTKEAPIVATNFCRIITPKPGWSDFVYGALRTSWDRGDFFQYENGTSGIKNLNLAHYLASTRLPTPSEKALERFRLQANSLHSMQVTSARENESLSQLRETLLPQLMSGKLRVREAEKVVEGAI